MAPKRKPQTFESAIPHSAGKVTAANYDALAKAWVAKHKPRADETVCRSWRGADDRHPETPERWCAWLAFLRQIGVVVEMAVDRGVLMVPARWPWDFSADAGPIEGRLSGLLRAYAAERHAGGRSAAAPETPTRRLPQADLDAIKAQRRTRDETERRAAEERAKVLGEERRAFDDRCRRESFESRGIVPPDGVDTGFDLLIRLGWTTGPGPDGTTVMVRPGKGAM